MATPDSFWFKSVLAAKIGELVSDFGSYSELERELGGTLTRKQLKKLVDEKDDLPITCAQLQVLDSLLRGRERGESIASLFGNAPTVVRALADDKSVTVIMGSRPDPDHRRDDLSRWDIRAMREVLDALTSVGKSFQFRFEDVIFRETSAIDFTQQVIPAKEEWFHCLARQTSSVVCIGSPKACHAAEVVLGRMFDVRPFEPWPQTRARPFYFVWPPADRRSRAIVSAFQVLPEKLAAKQHKSSMAIWFDDQLHESAPNARQFSSFGVIAAQRRGDHTWVCISGLSGAATLGGARLLKDMTADLSIKSGKEYSKTAWAVVEVEVEEDRQLPSFRSDRRQVRSQRLVTPIRYFETE